MARYVLTCEHVPEDCLGDLDSIFSFSRELLGRFDWGCKDGEHVGWVVVEAQDETTARTLLPTTIRRKARVRKVNKFSQEDLQAAHEAIAAMQRPNG